VTLAWVSIGLAIVAVLAVSLARMLIRRERAGFEQSVAELAASSEAAESEGDLGKALVDLDAAIHLLASREGADVSRVEALRQRRLAVARREVAATLARLRNRGAGEFASGDWLTLTARVDTDRDLEALALEVKRSFRLKLREHIDALADEAARSAEAGRSTAALEGCEAARALLAHLPADDQQSCQARLDAIVDGMVEARGIVVEPIRGERLGLGGPGDRDATLSMIRRALSARGYAPLPEPSTWRDRWGRSPYRLAVEVNERHEGSYLTSENRLTRIDARLVLRHRDRPIWETRPTARTPVPLPKLPAYLSGHLALSIRRNPEFEKLLYDHARTSIEEKLAFALDHMPACGVAPR
jgi:hypothetical protein